MECKMCGDFSSVLIGGMCGSCKVESEMAQETIEKLCGEGHPYHCACRQAWGDGECECGLYQKGYDPYGWTET